MASPIITDGSADFSAGVDSLKTSTVQSAENPNGLTRSQLHWLINGTMRDGSLSPRSGWKFKGNLNGGIQAHVIPGTPGQTIPEPPIPPIQTPPTQEKTLTSNWTLSAVGATATINVTPSYIGNIGDSQLIPVPGGGHPEGEGFFIVTAFTPTTITLLATSYTNGAGAGQTQFANSDLLFYLEQLGPGIPQPPIIIPPGQPTVLPPIPLYQGKLNPLYAPTGPDSYSTSGTTYGICVIGGHVIAYDPDFNIPPLDLSQVWGLYLPPTTPRCYFVQALKYVLIQAGDYNSQTGEGMLPLYWDGQQIRQSNGITGITTVGQAIANFFSITVTNAWTPPVVGGQVTLSLAQPYTGPNQNLGDNLQITNAGAVLLGVFRVISISGNAITIQTIVSNSTALQAANGVFSCILSTPPTATQNVIIGNGFWTVPAVENQVRVNMTSMYFGSVGDTVTTQSENGSITYGTFKVVSFNNSDQIVLQTITSAFAGQQVTQGNLLVTATAVRTFSQSVPVDSAGGHSPGFVVSSVGSYSSIYWPAFDGNYNGFGSDVVTVSKGNVVLGTFRVVGTQNYFDGDHNYPGIQLETLASNFDGNVYQGPLTVTVVLPISNPQLMTLNSGQWTMPPVGSSVSLQLVWEGSGDSPPEGPAYPGNIGDTVTLSNISPAFDIGQFLVTAFDDVGNITLRVVVPTNGFTNLTPGTVIVGPTAASMAITQVPSSTGTLINQIPAATAMVFYMGRIWYAQGATVSAGDIAGDTNSGTSANGYLDAVLCVTENPLIIGGDGFTMPSGGDNITALAIPQMINASLGEGLLNIGTANGVFALQVPATRAAWIAANASNQPQIFVVQLSNGFANDWSVVSVNGDLWFQSYLPDIRSLLTAVRYFQQWGNVSLSSNEDRILKTINTNLLGFSSGIYFDNRLLMTTYPQQTPNGVIHPALIPLDLSTISTLEQQDPPNWEGQQEGLQIFQLGVGTFGQKQRAFAITLSSITPGEIDLWELVPDQIGDISSTQTNRIGWQATFPGFTWGSLFKTKKLVSAELWIDELVGVCEIEVEYSPDGSACFQKWAKFSVCSAADSTQLPTPINYPVIIFQPGVRKPLVLPLPPDACNAQTGRPSNQGYEFQPRITFKGQCRLRGLRLHAEPVQRPLYEGVIAVCGNWIKSCFQSIIGG